MVEKYMSVGEICQYLGITQGAWGNMKTPPHDAEIGRFRGWRKETIDQWNAQRPGHGGRPFKK